MLQWDILFVQVYQGCAVASDSQRVLHLLHPGPLQPQQAKLWRKFSSGHLKTQTGYQNFAGIVKEL